jgi:hypothetical protein
MVEGELERRGYGSDCRIQTIAILKHGLLDMGEEGFRRPKEVSKISAF